MADETLQGLKIAILVTDGFEEVELTQPRKTLDQAGADTRVVSPKDDEVRSWNFTDWGQKLPVDLKLDEARPQDFEALLLPGGVINPDKLRMIPAAVAFVKAFFDAGNPSQRSAMAHGRSSRRTRPAAGV
jgi:protease I